MLAHGYKIVRHVFTELGYNRLIYVCMYMECLTKRTYFFLSNFKLKFDQILNLNSKIKFKF